MQGGKITRGAKKNSIVMNIYTHIRTRIAQEMKA